MSTDKNNRQFDRDQELQNKDRDHQLQSPNPERLKDEDHKMNKRTNEVQGEVSYDQNVDKDNAKYNHDMDSQWKDIQGAYRKRYPDVTDEDVNYKSGEFDIMTGRIAKRTNRNREDVNNEIRDWQS